MENVSLVKCGERKRGQKKSQRKELPRADALQ